MRRREFIAGLGGAVAAWPFAACAQQDGRAISLVLRNTDMTKLAQVRAARTGVGEPVQEAKDILGRDVLTVYAPVAPLRWLVFVEMPIEEAK